MLEFKLGACCRTPPARMVAMITILSKFPVINGFASMIKRMGCGQFMVVVVVVTMMLVLQAPGAEGKDSVQITNGMDVTLLVWCKSKNDDLGVVNMGPGQVWGFRFNDNIFGSTLFTCSAQARGYKLVSLIVWQGWSYSAPAMCNVANRDWTFAPSGIWCNGKFFESWPH